MERPTHIICDIDGVLRREGDVMPGVPELFCAMYQKKVVASLLSNNSRVRGKDVATEMDTLYQVNPDHIPHAITSADATAAWIKENPSNDPERGVYLVGGPGIRMKLVELGILLRTNAWNGKQWNGDFPSDVICGFSKEIDYPTLSGGWNAIRQGGARFIATNPDPEYRAEGGLLLPANGAAVGYLRTAGTEPIVIGKPDIIMAEMALRDTHAKKESSHIAILGDTVDQDVALANNLRKAGWNTEAWVVLTGVLDQATAESTPNIHRIFQDITDVRRQMFT